MAEADKIPPQQRAHLGKVFEGLVWHARREPLHQARRVREEQQVHGPQRAAEHARAEDALGGLHQRAAVGAAVGAVKRVEVEAVGAGANDLGAAARAKASAR
jgi:hypothetical protein